MGTSDYLLLSPTSLKNYKQTYQINAVLIKVAPLNSYTAYKQSVMTYILMSPNKHSLLCTI